MVDIYEALKVISVFSEYEYKGNKINIFFKWFSWIYVITYKLNIMIIILSN